jgi:hypothetical protein
MATWHPKQRDIVSFALKILRASIALWPCVVTLYFSPTTSPASIQTTYVSETERRVVYSYLPAKRLRLRDLDAWFSGCHCRLLSELMTERSVREKWAAF